jgi:hypothetical protein
MLTEDSEKWPFRATLGGVFFGRKPILDVPAYRQGVSILCMGPISPDVGNKTKSGRLALSRCFSQDIFP